MESLSFAEHLKGSPQVLLEGNQDLEKRIEYLITIIDKGLAQVKEIQTLRIQGLMNSYIELSIDNYNPLLGSNIMLKGHLFSDDKVLANKNIELYFQGSFLGSIDTNNNGSFTYNFEVPFLYEKQHLIRAEYFPLNEDIQNFAPSVSEITYTPIYYTPVISAQIPDTVYSGKEYEITGSLEFPGNTQVKISLEIFDLISTQEITNNFIFRFTVPKGQNHGKYSAKLTTEPNGLVGPTSLVDEITVEYLPSRINSEQNFFLILARSLKVKGSVGSQGIPVSKCSIECSIGKQKFKSVTDSNGNFIVNIDLNPLSLSSQKTLIITALPTQHWISGNQIVKKVIVVNILTLIPFPLIFIIYIYLQKSRATHIINETQTLSNIESETKYQILSGFSLIYQGALNLIQSRTGVKISSNNTLREYLEIIQNKLPRKIFRLFRQVTRYYERWVYGASKRRPPIKISSQIIAKISDEDE
jgi:hypothetical protein